MAGGPGPTGFAAFLAVKYAGYSLAGGVLNWAYSTRERSAWKVGLVRTVIGVAAGVTFGLAAMYLPIGGWLFFGGLIPVRVLEWGLLLRLFYEAQFLATPRAWRWSAAGVVWSFLLDAIGVGAALVVPGGIWVC
jgi:hypothetical protein